jgi:glycerate dehydrogenase
MKIAILDKIALGEDTPLEILNDFGEVTVFSTTSPEERISHIGDSEIIVLNKVKITEDVMASCKSLKLICVFATGYDNIDISAAKKHGIAVCNVPGYSTDSVVLFTLATVLSLVTHLSEYSEYVKCGAYSASPSANKITPVFHELRGKTWGIVGFGNIGKAVAKVAEAMGAHVIVNKRTEIKEYKCVDIDTLCKSSDIITVHCPLNDQTRGIINKERLSLMKKSAVLVNEARGAVLNEADVASAVLEKQIAAFGCDVYSTEPFDTAHPYNKIKNLDNVILTPHAAWGAYEARERCIRIISQNISSFITGGNLNRVDM